MNAINLNGDFNVLRKIARNLFRRKDPENAKSSVILNGIPMTVECAIRIYDDSPTQIFLTQYLNNPTGSKRYHERYLHVRDASGAASLTVSEMITLLKTGEFNIS